jgi:hypothetical protein
MNKYDVLLLVIVVVISAAVALGMKGSDEGASMISTQKCISARRIVVETRGCNENHVCTQAETIRRSRALEEIKDCDEEVE